MNGAPVRPLSSRSPDAPLPTSSAAAAPSSTSFGISGVPVNPSNRAKILQVAHRLAYHMRAGIRPDQAMFDLCFSLARGIDYAVSHKDIPSNAHDLPAIIKKIYQLKGETFLQPAIMILLIAAKNASRNNWFLPADTEDILAMANEISSALSTNGGISRESNSNQILADIILRFYPQIKLVRLLAIFEVKLGYDILVADIYIPRNMGSEDRIRLFVFQADNIETSSCIINPQQMNFLVNGKGVERRTNNSQDTGPQFPTDITKMLKYGMNLFQAVGSVSGNYIIAIAVVNLVKTSSVPELQDYSQPVQDNTLDSEIIEGPSRISLNCPISFKRIKTPVKGHLCKHRQCFDYENYMEMNLRKPTWRCPHCNQSVTYVDLRMDRYMLKILEEAGEGVSDVIILADGSWNVIEVQQATGTQLQTRSSTGHQRSSEVIPPEGVLSSSPDIVDLTIEDLEDESLIPAKRSSEGEDRKSVHGTAFSTWQTPVMVPKAGSEVLVGDLSRISSGLDPNLSTFHAAGKNPQLNANLCSVGTNLANPVSSSGACPVLDPGISAGPGTRASTTLAQCLPQAIQTREHLWLMHHFENSVNNESGRSHLPHGHTPNSNQPVALGQLQHVMKRARIDGSTLQSSSGFPTQRTSMPLYAASQGPGSPKLYSTRPTSGQLVSNSVRQPTLGAHTDSRILNIRPSNLLPHQTMGQIASSLPRTYRSTAAVRVPSPTGTGVAAGSVVNQQSGLLAARHAPQMSTLRIGQTSLQTSRVTQSTYPTMDSLGHTGQHVDNSQVTGSMALRSDASPGISGLQSQSQQEWRPTGRMRGSLSGQAYSDALSHYVSSPPHLPTRPAVQATATAATTSPATFSTVPSPPPHLLAGPAVQAAATAATTSLATFSTVLSPPPHLPARSAVQAISTAATTSPATFSTVLSRSIPASPTPATNLEGKSPKNPS